MTILIVDDNAGFRRLLRGWLANFVETVVAECEDGESAPGVYQAQHPDLTLMDLALPGVSGLVALSQILARDRAAKVVVLTSFDDDDLRNAALASGATAYVLKDELQRLEPIISATRADAIKPKAPEESFS
jgi:DNA-binding NarL/FixJ family response regulator